jgi:formylmethanofuran dehydrogenase subunit E
VLSGAPLFRILPFRPARVGILAAGGGTPGPAESRCIPILRNKAEAFGCTVVKTLDAAGGRAAVRRGLEELRDAGAELLLVAAEFAAASDGDPAFQGLLEAGAADLLHGAPILPGAGLLLARIGSVRVIGLPARVPFHRRTALDLVLPRLLAGIELTREDLARFGHGGICLECHHCAFPKCPFGK